MSERWYQELWGSDDTLIDSGDFDHVTVALGNDFGIRVVATPEDYDEVHADIESMIRQCLRRRRFLGVRLEAARQGRGRCHDLDEG